MYYLHTREKGEQTPNKNPSHLKCIGGSFPHTVKHPKHRLTWDWKERCFHLGLLNVNLFLFNKGMRQVLPLICCVISSGARAACLARHLELLESSSNASHQGHQEQWEIHPRLHPRSPLTHSVYELHPFFRARSGSEEGRQGMQKGRAGMLSPCSRRCPWEPALGAEGGAAKPGAALPSSAAPPDCSSTARKHSSMARLEWPQLQLGLVLGFFVFFKR